MKHVNSLLSYVDRLLSDICVHGLLVGVPVRYLALDSLDLLCLVHARSRRVRAVGHVPGRILVVMMVVTILLHWLRWLRC